MQILRLEKNAKTKTTKLAEALDTIKKSEEKIQTLLVKLHVGVAVFSPEGEVLVCNRKFLELVSSKDLRDKGQHFIEQSLAEQSLIEHLPKVSLEEIIEHYINEDGQKLTMQEFPLVKVISTGKSAREQIIGIRNPDNGFVRWTMGDHEPEFDESGKLSKIIVTIVNITKEKKQRRR